jgi:tetratricopeptide (TPR) repeat protein
VKRKGILIVVLLFVGLMATLGAIKVPGFYRMVKSRDRLNNGALAYSKGDYDTALTLFKEAMELDPDEQRSRLFYAAALVAKYNLSNDKELAVQALEIYEDIHAKDAANCDAIAYIAVINRYLADSAESEAERTDLMNKYRDWTVKRLDCPGLTEKAKAEIYYTLGQGYYVDSSLITERYVITRPPAPVDYQVPESEIPAVKELVQLGLENLNKATELDPEYGDAFAYINLLYRQQAKVESDPKRKAELTKLADEVRNKAIEILTKKKQEQEQQQAQPQK